MDKDMNTGMVTWTMNTWAIDMVKDMDMNMDIDTWKWTWIWT